MKKILLSLAFLAGVSLTVSAQFKIGGKTINTKKVINAATDVAHAATLSDEDVAKMAKEYIQWMDTHNEVAGPDTEMGQRLERLTANVKKVSGLDLNFKVYNVVDVNAFACGDGSVRVCGGLMKSMDDDEVFAVIGHEIGHVVHSDSKDAMKNAYLTSAAKNAAGAVSGTVSKLTDSQLGDMAQALAGAQYSQKQEYEADEFGFQFCIDNGRDPYGMSNSLNKLLQLSESEAKSSKFMQMFSSHPETQKRADRVKEKADEYVKSKQ